MSSITDSSSSQTPIPWEEIVATVLEPVYNDFAKDEDIALFFVFCAIGVSMDHQKQPDDPVARRYAHLARISLMLGDDLLCSKSLTIIRCLVRVLFHSGICSITLTPCSARAVVVLSHLIGPCGLLKGLDAHCNGSSDGTGRMFFLQEPVQAFLKLAQAGLHRDSERWNSFPEEAEKRRKLW